MSTVSRNYVVSWVDIAYCVIYYGLFFLQIYLISQWLDPGPGVGLMPVEQAVIIGIGCAMAAYTLYLGFVKRRILAVMFHPMAVNPLFFGWGAMAVSVVLAFFAFVPAALACSL